MKIIDRETGKRIGVDEVKRHLNEVDPIFRNVEKDENMEELSPMDPPDAYDSKHILGGLSDSELTAEINELVHEHKSLSAMVSSFEVALLQFYEGGYFITKEINDAFNAFFVYFDEEILPHNRKEERYLFPLLHKRLIESGEHGKGESPSTAVDLMEDDHIKFIQLASLTFNLMGLAIRLQDSQSRAMVFDLAYHNGKELAELLKLHIFREDNTLFPLAQKLITKDEMAEIFRLAISPKDVD